MNLYPAIDLYEGQVVRLQKGDFNQKTVYSSDPAAFAKKWEDQGAQWLHVVDLNGAKSGELKNLSSLEKIRKAVKCRIEMGGGLRSVEAIRQVLELGMNRAIVGTRALDEKFLQIILDTFGNKIALGLDAKDGYLQTQGWLAQGLTLEDALKKLNEYPVSTVIYTDIHKDGMLAGPNFDGLEKVLNVTKSNVILSGGVSSMEDLIQCSNLTQKNFEGAIIGKALYEGKIHLEAAVKKVQS